MFKSKELD